MQNRFYEFKRQTTIQECYNLGNTWYHWRNKGFPCDSAGKESACNVGYLGLIPGLGRSPGEGKATHNNILAWTIPWIVQSMGLQRVGQDWATFTFKETMVIQIHKMLHKSNILSFQPRSPTLHKGSPETLEWIAYPFSSRSFQPRNQTRVCCIAGEFCTNWAIREALLHKLSFFISLDSLLAEPHGKPLFVCRW